MSGTEDHTLPSVAAAPLSSDDLGRRKRWLVIVPAVFVTYSLAYLDRANYGFGAAAGLATTLHITESRSALLGSLFFLGYFLLQLPGAAYARRTSVSRAVFLALMLWGTLAALTGVIRSFWLLALDRLLLGAAESVIFPAMLVLLTRWFTRAERSRANTLLILGNPVTVLWMSAITGFLIRSLGWQMTFIVEGVPSILWACAWLLLVRDRPSLAPWMTQATSLRLEAQIAEEQRSIPKILAVRRAFLRPDVLVLSGLYFCWSLGIYGFVLWLPTIIRHGASLDIARTGLLAAVPYLLAIVLMLVNSYMSDRTLRRHSLVWPFLMMAGIALLGSFLLARQSFWLSYVCLILAGGAMYAPYGPFFAIIPEIVPDTVTVEVLALVNSSGALGGFAGTWLVGLLQARTGNSRAGFLLMSVSLIAAGLAMLGLKARRPAADQMTTTAGEDQLAETPQLEPKSATE